MESSKKFSRNSNGRVWGIKIKNRGPNLFKYTNLNNLRFADDVVLIAKSREEQSYMVEDLRRVTMNLSKTKIMTNLKCPKPIVVVGEAIEIVPEYGSRSTTKWKRKLKLDVLMHGKLFGP